MIPKRHELLSDLFTANGLIQRSYIKYFQFETSCPSRVPSCYYALAIALQFIFVLLYAAFPHFALYF